MVAAAMCGYLRMTTGIAEKHSFEHHVYTVE